MSTFEGKIENFPSISIDNFTGKNRTSEIFFLSHCHTDHMDWITDWGLKGVLYTSSISKQYLERHDKFVGINRTIKEINVGEPIKVKAKEGIITVTAFHAYHCTGSLMFVFQRDANNKENSENGSFTTLYTGDFRFDKTQDYSALKNFTFDEVHFDTTFFEKNYPEFPTLEEGMNRIIKVVQQWLKADDKVKVLILQTAKNGMEDIYFDVYKKLGYKTLYNEDFFKIPEFNDAFTDDKEEARIIGTYLKNERYCKEENIRKIELFTSKFTNWVREDIVEDALHDEQEISLSKRLSVCYAIHSSYNELKCFLMDLNFKKAFCNVLDKRNMEGDKVSKEELILEIMEEMKVNRVKIKDIVKEENSLLKETNEKSDQTSKLKSEGLQETTKIVSIATSFGRKRSIEDKEHPDESPTKELRESFEHSNLTIARKI